MKKFTTLAASAALISTLAVAPQASALSNTMESAANGSVQVCRIQFTPEEANEYSRALADALVNAGRTAALASYGSEEAYFASAHEAGQWLNFSSFEELINSLLPIRIEGLQEYAGGGITPETAQEELAGDGVFNQINSEELAEAKATKASADYAKLSAQEKFDVEYTIAEAAESKKAFDSLNRSLKTAYKKALEACVAGKNYDSGTTVTTQPSNPGQDGAKSEGSSSTPFIIAGAVVAVLGVIAALAASFKSLLPAAIQAMLP